jgi:nitrate/nitrite-specific signal transduction histidine kinase
VPNVTFDNEKLNEKYSKFSTDKVPNFVNDVKSFVLTFDREALKKRVEKDSGILRFRLND